MEIRIDLDRLTQRSTKMRGCDISARAQCAACGNPHEKRVKHGTALQLAAPVIPAKYIRIRAADTHGSRRYPTIGTTKQNMMVRWHYVMPAAALTSLRLVKLDG